MTKEDTKKALELIEEKNLVELITKAVIEKYKLNKHTRFSIKSDNGWIMMEEDSYKSFNEEGGVEYCTTEQVRVNPILKDLFKNAKLRISLYYSQKVSDRIHGSVGINYTHNSMGSNGHDLSNFMILTDYPIIIFK